VDRLSASLETSNIERRQMLGAFCRDRRRITIPCFWNPRLRWGRFAVRVSLPTAASEVRATRSARQCIFGGIRGWMPSLQSLFRRPAGPGSGEF